MKLISSNCDFRFEKAKGMGYKAMIDYYKNKIPIIMIIMLIIEMCKH